LTVIVPVLKNPSPPSATIPEIAWTPPEVVRDLVEL